MQIRKKSGVLLFSFLGVALKEAKRVKGVTENDKQVLRETCCCWCDERYWWLPRETCCASVKHVAAYATHAIGGLLSQLGVVA